MPGLCSGLLEVGAPSVSPALCHRHQPLFLLQSWSTPMGSSFPFWVPLPCAHPCREAHDLRGLFSLYQVLCRGLLQHLAESPLCSQASWPGVLEQTSLPAPVSFPVSPRSAKGFTPLSDTLTASSVLLGPSAACREGPTLDWFPVLFPTPTSQRPKPAVLCWGWAGLGAW